MKKLVITAIVLTLLLLVTGGYTLSRWNEFKKAEKEMQPIIDEVTEWNIKEANLKYELWELQEGTE